MKTVVVKGEEIRMDVGAVIGPEMIALPDFPYVYVWGAVPRLGQACRMIACENTGGCRVEFEDGGQAITRITALRKKEKVIA